MPDLNEERWSEMKKHDRTKQKGDFSHKTSPLLRFFEDLVRIPDHNKVIPKSVGSRERPAFPFTLPELSVVRVSPIQFSILVAESLEGRGVLSSAGRLLLR
jgi:hypothetical protein